jgi:hypothetical protein
MKRLLLLLSFASLFLLTAVNSFAQNFVPDSVANKPVTISLKGKYHATIYALMPAQTRGEAVGINYALQIAKQAKAGGKTVYDTAAVYSATTTYKMLTDTYFNLSDQKEGLTAQENEDMKESLIPQLTAAGKIDLLLILKKIDDWWKENREGLRSVGSLGIMAINP